ncbi:PKD domain-containing protein [Nitrososphaera sp.]|uniref:PKD domain-containing protein n=1 Tax=Nitrososphaera sp. TaxID=1971748 RepID=UPI00307D943D
MTSATRKYGIIIAMAVAVAAVLAFAYLYKPAAVEKPRPLVITADNFFKIRVGEDAPFFAAAKGGVKPYKFEWDFGDGTRSPLQNVTHSYSETGTYRVTLKVTDSAGTVQDVSHTVDVYPVDANFTRGPDLRR